MAVDKKSFRAVVEDILRIEDQRKDLAEEIKEQIEGFCEQHQLDKGNMKKAIAQYKQYLKDSQKFTASDQEVEELRSILTDRN